MPTESLLPCIDANRVAGKLWQGSRYTESVCTYDLVDHVVLTASEHQMRDANYMSLTRLPLFDEPRVLTHSEVKYVFRAASRVRTRLNQGESVLVTCVSGLNRSGLLCAMVLMMPATDDSPTPGGMLAPRAIRAVRSARGPRALSNPYFVQFLESL